MPQNIGKVPERSTYDRHMKPPISTKKQSPKKRNDLDPKLSCRVCGKYGLRYRSKTCICVDCLRELPYMVKTNGTTGLPRILQNYANYMIDRFGIEHSARLVEVEIPILHAMAHGKRVFALPTRTGPSESAAPQQAEDEPVERDVPIEVQVDPHDIPADVLAVVMERYKALRPLGPELAGLVGPWRRPLEIELAREGPGPRQQRLNRAALRAGFVCHVPHPGAPMDPSAARNAFGRTERLGRRRRTLPMRVCLGLWSLGFGGPAIARITAETQWPTSKSSVARMLKQARNPFPGSQAVKAAVLAIEVADRPLLHSVEQRASRHDKRKHC